MLLGFSIRYDTSVITLSQSAPGHLPRSAQSAGRQEPSTGKVNSHMFALGVGGLGDLTFSLPFSLLSADARNANRTHAPLDVLIFQWGPTAQGTTIFPKGPCRI